MKKIILLFALAAIVAGFNSCHSGKTSDPASNDPAAKFPFRDTSLSIDQRVDDLVSRMTLEEKIGQMMNAAPAIPRLGIPEYNWWNECLHGVARAGLATVFPQAIGLGAAWDEDMQFRVATAISDEARAKHHDFARKGKRLIYEGLTFWSPNINIFRDPRWGRGQETYGEDPYLTGRLAVQFIKGLQGDDPKYYKTIATVKHFAVHSGPEPERHFFDAQADERDFRETYLPQFEMGIKEGKAYSVMCAYNRYHGEACCGSSHLLTTILRKEWNFPGYVVSDCGAIDDIYEHHKIVATPEEAGALAVKSGCDLECATTYTHLKEAVQKKIITEAEIDIAVKRLFTARFRLGLFDPGSGVKYASIPYSVVDSKEHKELALEAARKSIVLLKNDDHLLPLKKDLKTLAVIGPNADEWTMLLGNYNGLPSKAITPLEGIREKMSPGSRVLYARGSELAEGLPNFDRIPGSVLSHGPQKGLQTDYYNNKEFTGGILFSEVDSALDANWHEGSPRKDMNDDNFGVKWTGEISPEQSGVYQLGIITTCKVNLYLDDSIIANTSYHFRDEFNDPRLRKSKPISLIAGKRYRLRIEAGESSGDARVQLVWSKQRPNIREELKKEALATARQADAVVLCMGLSARLEGEEMDVDLAGFKSGDRTTLDLPKIQEDLIREITALGKPVVLVLLNGSALSVNWAQNNIPAIVEAWYPGQAGGQALADVLFGNYNPAGRLPVTFYTGLGDLPAFGDYAMAGRTYRYFKKPVLYPFGYGLSYTTFRYDTLYVEAKAKPGDSVHVSAVVKNTGTMAGDEVAQVYVSALDAKVPVPLRSLRGFRRIHLAPGETKKVKFAIAPEAFTVIDDKMQRVPLHGRFTVSVGGRQPGVVSNGTSNIVSMTFARPSDSSLTQNQLPADKPAVQDTLVAQVATKLDGSTRDLYRLTALVSILKAGQSFPAETPDADKLIIIKDGSLSVNSGHTKKILGPGGIALIAAGDTIWLSNTSATACKYYVLSFMSRSSPDRERAKQAGPPIFLDWPDMPMKTTEKGESRQIFNRPVTSLSKIDMHATTLNEGQVSHLPHIHRNEEIILMRSGYVQMYIGGKYYPAKAGDIVFLTSGTPHALENKTKGRCEYFALQWQQ